MNAQALKGHLDMLVLAALETHELHGYALIQELARRSSGAFDLPEGTIYPVLHRLETQGLLTSNWASHAGRRRRVYRLTRSGAAALAGQRRGWESFAQAVGRVLEAAP
jgi:PadR family transcriptional regulator